MIGMSTLRNVKDTLYKQWARLKVVVATLGSKPTP